MAAASSGLTAGVASVGAALVGTVAAAEVDVAAAHLERRRAEILDVALEALRHAVHCGRHGDDDEHADRHAAHGEERAELVGLDGLERDEHALERLYEAGEEAHGVTPGAGR